MIYDLNEASSEDEFFAPSKATDCSVNSIRDEDQQLTREITTVVTNRKIDEIKSKRSDTLPFDMPKGPWKTHTVAKQELNEWALDFTTRGSFEGWTVVSGNFIHNHDLVESHCASLAEALLRQIPSELNSLGFELKRAGLTATKINQVFHSKAHEKHLQITWTYQDVYNKFQPSIEERGFDATNL